MPLDTFCEGKGTALVSRAGEIPEVIVSILPLKGGQTMRRNCNEFRNAWFSWEDKISITIFDFPILLVRKYEWLEKESSNWLVQVMGVDLFSSITRKMRLL